MATLLLKSEEVVIVRKGKTVSDLKEEIYDQSVTAYFCQKSPFYCCQPGGCHRDLQLLPAFPRCIQLLVAELSPNNNCQQILRPRRLTLTNLFTTMKTQIRQCM